MLSLLFGVYNVCVTRSGAPISTSQSQAQLLSKKVSQSLLCNGVAKSNGTSVARLKLCIVIPAF